MTQTMRELTADELKAVSGGAGECGHPDCVGATIHKPKCGCLHPGK